MNKKFTLLATAFLTIGTWSADAADKVPSAEWTAGNYYYLKAADEKFLSLDGNRADSVIVKDVTTSPNKASRDSALWEITKVGEETATVVYQIKNKKTKQLLSFSASSENAVIKDGFNKWAISEEGKISTNAGKMVITVDDKTVVLNSTGTGFTVEKPDTMTMSPQDLGNGFSTFQLNFGVDYAGNIFTGKDLIAKTVGDYGFVTLQVKGDESFDDGKEKFLGVDTLKTSINNAVSVFGAKFASDSARVGNERCQHFKFVVDLQNDSLSMFVAGAPEVNGSLALSKDTVCVVYAQTADTKVLTVSNFKDGKASQGIIPLITVTRGTPATIAKGTGVYFLKVANKNANNGKYIVSKKEAKLQVMNGKPSVNQPEGQWYIKENNGKYSIVDRVFNSPIILDSEVFAVQGMENTYTFAGTQDSITVEFQDVNLNDKYLGTLHFSEKELADNGYVLNLIPGASGAANLYAFVTDSILKGKVGDGKDAAVFRLVPDGIKENGGAVTIGDQLFVVSYKLKALFNKDSVAIQKDSLKFTELSADAFEFFSDATGEKYLMKSGNKYVGMNNSTACLQMTGDISYVTLEAVDAPEYASFDNVHKRLSYNNNSLVMNPYTLLAEMKTVGNEIATKAGYVEDNFSLWVQKAAVVEGKQLYFISSAMMNGTEKTNASYYLAAKDTLGGRAVFAYNDTIKTMKNSPALFAFKTAEDGGYYLENQSELAKPADERKPYLGSLNGFAIMQAEPSAAFIVETVSAPTPNEEITVSEVKVVGNEGDVLIANAAGRKITLSNILGQNVGTQRASSDNFTMPATKGVILVTVEGVDTYKVIVK